MNGPAETAGGQEAPISLIDQLWHADALQVVTTPEQSLERYRAERLYTLCTLAKAQAEAREQDRSELAGAQADHLNTLYNEGLNAAAIALGRPGDTDYSRTLTEWQDYTRVEIYSKAKYHGEAPADLTELAVAVHTGQAWFDN